MCISIIYKNLVFFSPSAVSIKADLSTMAIIIAHTD